MHSTGKIHLQLLLLIAISNAVLSCLITNCPKGGKRSAPNLREPASPFPFRKIPLRYPKMDDCPEGSPMCATSIGRCLDHELRCSKGSCMYDQSCRFEFPLLLMQRFKSIPVIFEKLLSSLLYAAARSLKEREEGPRPPPGVLFPAPMHLL